LKEQNDKPIAFGRTAEIYTWSKGQVLKLFYEWYNDEDIEYERRIAKAVHSSGLPVPFVGDVIKKDGRTGLVYEQINGFTMSEKISSKPWTIFPCAVRMAELHSEMHKKTIQADIPKQRRRIRDKISHAEALPNTLRSLVLTALEDMPDGNQLCHGDFHPSNIMISGGNEITIDWVDTSLGNPMADLARTSIILLGSAENTEELSRWMKPFVRAFHRRYIRHYFSLNPGCETEYSSWLPIIAAARLSENISDIEKWLIAQVRMISRNGY